MRDLIERLETAASKHVASLGPHEAHGSPLADLLREAAAALRASTEGESARVDGGDRRYLKAWVANLERNLAALRPGSLSHEDCEADLEVLRRVIRALEPAPPSSEQGEDS